MMRNEISLGHLGGKEEKEEEEEDEGKGKEDWRGVGGGGGEGGGEEEDYKAHREGFPATLEGNLPKSLRKVLRGNKKE
ncbi:hypothetical protein E2C01_084338 [Portunus trituberculatus]|uniref:Uncharacterized protein n=1 Tax=Portunus trituberculatus TaxID=210409 RepID=A0A5B7J4J4_PORTR|nr:hypothetical protein [Portunus trituberculatus]